jgi:hypothetical protein
MAFAAEPVELSAAQMDNVTAGFADTFDLTRLQINIAPTIQIVNQIAVAVTVGSGSSSAVNVAGLSNDVRQR